MTNANPHGFVLNHTMVRIKDPARSLPFYCDLLDMTLLDRYDFPEMGFTLYFLGYPAGPVPDDEAERVDWVFAQSGLLELTHNWGSELDSDLTFHDGNSEPRGFGHFALSLADVDAVCTRLEAQAVTFVKRPDEGAMKGIAFVRDPDGYWIELLAPRALRDIVMTAREARRELR